MTWSQPSHGVALSPERALHLIEAGAGLSSFASEADPPIPDEVFAALPLPANAVAQ
jgi:hypothetical protein